MAGLVETNNTAAAVAPNSADIVCTCAEMTRDGFLAAMAANRDLEYGVLLEKTGAGMKCTACRLDLELLYSENFDRVVGRIQPANGGPAREASLPLKARLYGWVDRISPMVSVHLSNTVPVLRQNGVRQYVLICNDQPLFQNEAPDPVMVRLIVRDAAGRTCMDERYEVTMEQALDVEVSSVLPAPADEQPSIGSVEVLRWWKKPTRRGTTRPQILIEAPGGCGAVHTTGPSGPGATWFTCLARPGEDRLLLGIVNPTGSRLRIAVSYPYASGVDAEECEVAIVPGHGARLHEVRLPEAAAAKLRGQPFALKCQADGMHKVYLITATSKLDRFAIDHPAG